MYSPTPEPFQDRIKVKLIKEIGTRAYLRVYWDEYRMDNVRNYIAGVGTCAGADGKRKTYHNAMMLLANSPVVGDWEAGGKAIDYPNERWPTTCEDCGAEVPTNDILLEVSGSSPWSGDYEGVRVHRQIFRQRLYDNPSGKPEAGDAFYLNYPSRDKEKHDCMYWDNCVGPHLYVVLPNGTWWDIDSRCSNCTMRDDRQHRCWVRTGVPGIDLNVGKGGHTCSAGAGSIALDNWHGFLHNNEVYRC